MDPSRLRGAQAGRGAWGGAWAGGLVFHADWASVNLKLSEQR